MALTLTFTFLITNILSYQDEEIVDASQPTFPHINYLGAGYDILNGNPQTIYNFIDPGFKILPKILLSTSNNNTQIITYNHDECSICNAYSTIIKSMDDYILHLQSDISVKEHDNNRRNTSFTQSKTYRTFNEIIYKSQQKQSVIVSVTNFCNVYKAKFKDDGKILSKEFIRDIIHLRDIRFDETNSLSPYYKFIDKYGQYYASQINFGNKYTQYIVFNKSAWNSMLKKDMNITNLSITYYQMSIGIDITNKKQSELAKEYKSYSFKEISTNINKQRAYPIKYKLECITNLILMKYVDDEQCKTNCLNVIKNNLLNAHRLKKVTRSIHSRSLLSQSQR